MSACPVLESVCVYHSALPAELVLQACTALQHHPALRKLDVELTAVVLVNSLSCWFVDAARALVPFLSAPQLRDCCSLGKNGALCVRCSSRLSSCTSVSTAIDKTAACAKASHTALVLGGHSSQAKLWQVTELGDSRNSPAPFASPRPAQLPLSDWRTRRRRLDLHLACGCRVSLTRPLIWPHAPRCLRASALRRPPWACPRCVSASRRSGPPGAPPTSCAVYGCDAAELVLAPPRIASAPHGAHLLASPLRSLCLGAVIQYRRASGAPGPARPPARPSATYAAAGRRGLARKAEVDAELEPCCCHCSHRSSTRRSLVSLAARAGGGWPRRRCLASASSSARACARRWLGGGAGVAGRSARPWRRVHVPRATLNLSHSPTPSDAWRHRPRSLRCA